MPEILGFTQSTGTTFLLCQVGLGLPNVRCFGVGELVLFRLMLYCEVIESAIKSCVIENNFFFHD